jgi:peptidoglycan/xylan/chitin deacetylase (PgdA/CDA1 family)
VLALTFDDGPDPRGTPAVLDALAGARVRATFFVLGDRAERYPELLARVRDEGHEVEVHGFAHLRHPRTTRRAVERDIDRALATIGGARLWRIPWGHLAGYTRDVAKERGLRIVGWSADTHDWRGDSAEVMLAGLDLAHGGIVLAHDGISVGARRETAEETARLVPCLVEAARRRGLSPGPLTPDWPVPVPIGNPEFHPGVRSAG